MITQTSELAIRSLIYLALEGGETPVPPRRIAAVLECSQSYLAKVLGALVRSALLTSAKGAYGGVRLSRRPSDITLLEIVEACQGLLIANYCQKLGGLNYSPCGFHRAMEELYTAMISILSRWTLADLLQRPYTQDTLNGIPCKMMLHLDESLVGKDSEQGEAQ